MALFHARSVFCSKPSSSCLTRSLFGAPNPHQSANILPPLHHHSFHYCVAGSALSLSLSLAHHRDTLSALCSTRSNHHLTSPASCSLSHRRTIVTSVLVVALKTTSLVRCSFSLVQILQIRNLAGYEF